MNLSAITRLGVFILFGSLTACGGGGGGGSSASTPPSSGTTDPVAASLNALGIDTSNKPLKDASGNVLPDSYSPWGSRPKLNRLDELLLIGQTTYPQYTSPQMSVQSISPEIKDDLTSTIKQTQRIGWSMVNGNVNPDTPWESTDYIRGAASADLNDDGLNEELIVYQKELNLQGAPNPVQLTVMENTSTSSPDVTSFSQDAPIDISNDQVDFVNVVTGDFDGDSEIDAAVVLMEHTHTKIVFLKNTNGVLALTGKSITIPYINAGATETQAVVKVGNLDHDTAQELAVVINETQFSGTTPAPSAASPISPNSPIATEESPYDTSRVYLFDDANTDFKPIPIPGSAEQYAFIHSNIGGQDKAVVIGDVALGDVDGDGIDEVILGGIEQGYDVVNGVYDANTNRNTVKYLVYVLDDVVHGLVEKAHIEANHPNSATATDREYLYYMHLNTVDLRGDGMKEIQANEFVFDNLNNTTVDPSSTVPLLNKVYYMPPQDFMFNGENGNHVLTWRASSMVAANVLHLSGGQQQIVVHSETTLDQEVRIYGLDNSGTMAELYKFPAQSFSGGSTFFGGVNRQGPEYARGLQIIPTNVNNDSLVVKYITGKHEFVYTEPEIIAVLAAAPCWANKGQDTNSCTTQYGQSVSLGGGIDTSVSLSSSVSATIDSPEFLPAADEASATVKMSVQNTISVSADLTKTITYTNGGLHDAVIFTSIPMDIYFYQIITDGHAADEGKILQLQMPRKPITLMQSREYYNAHLVPGAMPIDNNVFQHTAGKPFTYLTSAQKDDLLSSISLVSNPWGITDTSRIANTFASFLQSTNIPVGEQASQNSSSTVSASIALSTQLQDTKAIDFGFEASLKTTIGNDLSPKVTVGLSIGVDRSLGLSVTTGSSTIFTGTVSQIATPYYTPANQYQFGVFTYFQKQQNPPAKSPNQQFQVVNYWVDPMQ